MQQMTLIDEPYQPMLPVIHPTETMEVSHADPAQHMALKRGRHRAVLVGHSLDFSPRAPFRLMSKKRIPIASYSIWVVMA